MHGPTRQPAVAGQFYPGTPSKLRSEVDEMLAAAQDAGLTGDVVGIVVPHAGYVFSGPTAAMAYRQVQGATYEAVVVMAPSHREPFHGVSIKASGAYGTPLGDTPINGEIAKAILSADPDVQESDMGHGAEHAVEVQVPFLQRTLPDVPIVPLVMMDRSWDVCQRLANALSNVADRHRILVVASSDLYHGPSGTECRATDEATIEALLSGDARAFCDKLETGDAQACGGAPIAVLMEYANRLGGVNATLLKKTTSAEASGMDTGYVVGYAAVAFIREVTEDSGTTQDAEEEYSREEREALLELARKSIVAAVEKAAPPKPPKHLPRLREPRGAFVTITRNGELCGCIGHMQAYAPLADTVIDMAKSAAVGDPRFPPMTSAELDDFEIEISVLSPMQEIDSPEEVVPGKHGLMVSGGGRRGVLLPQIPERYGWDRDTFLSRTCVKAGLPSSAWKHGDVTLEVFTAEVFGEA